MIGKARMSKLKEAKLALTYDDVSLVPQYSEIKSRKNPDISTYLFCESALFPPRAKNPAMKTNNIEAENSNTTVARRIVPMPPDLL